LPNIAGISTKVAKPNLDRRLLDDTDLLGQHEELLLLQLANADDFGPLLDERFLQFLVQRADHHIYH